MLLPPPVASKFFNAVWSFVYAFAVPASKAALAVLKVLTSARNPLLLEVVLTHILPAGRGTVSVDLNSGTL